MLFLDFFQLPPVRASYLFEPSKTRIPGVNGRLHEEEVSGYMFWLEFNKVIALHESMRH